MTSEEFTRHVEEIIRKGRAAGLSRDAIMSELEMIMDGMKEEVDDD